MYRQILVPVDGSPCSVRAARIALEIARRSQAGLCFVHAVPSRGGDDAPRKDWRVGEMLLEHWDAQAERAGVSARVRLEASDGVAEALVRVGRLEGADLIVMGTHAREGLPRLWLGSVAERVARQASVPVLLVRAIGEATEAPAFARILAPVDGSPPSLRALEHARDLAVLLGTTLELLYVIPAPRMMLANGEALYMDDDRWQREFEAEADAVIAQAREHLGAEPGVPIEGGRVQSRGERIGDLIARVASEHHADLIVIGTHGRAGFDRLLLGSVAERVAHRAQVPVLLVRSLNEKENK